MSGSIIDIGIGSLTNPAIPSDAAGGGARDIGVGDKPSLKCLVDVTAAFNVVTSLQIALQGAPDNGSGAPGAFTTYVTGPVVALAALIQGARLLEVDVPRPPAGVALPRYLQLSYIIVGGTNTTGRLKGWIVIDRIDIPGSQAGVLSGYPPGITIAN